MSRQLAGEAALQEREGASDRDHPAPGIVTSRRPLEDPGRNTACPPWKALQNAVLCLPVKHGNQSTWEHGSPA